MNRPQRRNALSLAHMRELIAAQLAAVHRVLYDEAIRRCQAGQPRDQVWSVLRQAAPRAFDLLEPSLAGLGVRSPAAVPYC